MREHNPNHIPTRIGKVQQILDESDPSLVEILMKKDHTAVETMIKHEKRHRELLVNLNKATVESDRRLKTMEAAHQLIFLKEALRLMDEAATKHSDVEEKEGFTLV